MPRRTALLLAAGLALAGCSSSTDDKKPFPTTAASPKIDLPPGINVPGGTAVQPAAATVELQVVKPSDVDAAIKKQAGKIVVVDVWATWCVPCKKEFHHLVDLHAKRAKDGVVCISVAWDEADDSDKAKRFLTEKGATFANFLVEKAETDTASWIKAMKIDAIPAVFVFGRDGKLARKFGGDAKSEFTYADVNKLMDELLTK